MSKQLYEEALADVKKVKEVAEANAQRAVLEAVTPRIRDLIERELLRESDESDDDSHPAPGSATKKGSLMTDDPDHDDDNDENEDASKADHDSEYEINLESVEMLTPVLKVAKINAMKKVESSLSEIAQSIDDFKKSPIDKLHNIEEVISNVETVYQYVQESIDDPDRKGTYESRLESYYKELNKLQESIMFQKTKKLVTEEDVTLKLTGLPDDIDLESIGVDLITGAEETSGEEGGDEELDLDLSDEGESEEEGSEESGEEEGSDEDLDLGEALSLSDDTIVEIDEGMLRREISRMRKLREEKDNSTKGHKLSAKDMDDFGGGKSKGAALAESDDEDLDEQDQLDELDSQEDLDEQDQLDELDSDVEESWKNESEMSQIGDRRTRDDIGGSSTSVPSKDKSNPAHRSGGMRNESLVRSLKLQESVQQRARRRASSIGLRIKEAKKSGNKRLVEFLTGRYNKMARIFNESVSRSNKFKALLNESKRTNVRSNENRRPGKPQAEKAPKTLRNKLAETRQRQDSESAETKLRNKLAETNLINAKLLFTNKLLQNESLTARQKAQVIEQLDSAKTVREAKLVYESLAKALVSPSRSVNESRENKVIGSASRATRPASTQTLSEGYEAERWAKLAGILK